MLNFNLLSILGQAGPKNFGFVHENIRTPAQNQLNFDLISQMPTFQLIGNGYWKAGPRAPIYDCVKKLNDGKLLLPLYQQVGSCFPADSIVLMGDGSQKPIQDVQVGDEVITHENKRRKVIDKFQRSYTGKMYSIQVDGLSTPLRCTNDHLLLTYENIAAVSRQESGRFKRGKSCWKSAENFKIKDRVLLPYGVNNTEYLKIKISDYVDTNIGDKKIDKDEIIVDEKFARLIGLYLAEGGLRKHSKSGEPCGINFSFGSHEQDLISETIGLIQIIFGLTATTCTSESKPTSTDVRVYSTQLAILISKFINGNVYSKYIPDIFFKSPKEVKLSLIKGWMDGDGYAEFNKKYCRVNGVTVSPQLSKDMLRISLSCKLRGFLNTRKQESHQRVPSISLDFYSNDVSDIYPEYLEESSYRPAKPKHERLNNGFVGKVKSIQTIDVVATTVYNLEVEEEHSYVVNNIAVHNCVGHGLAKTLWYLSYVQNVLLGKFERPTLPYEPYGYAQSRVCGGLSGYEDGSFGSAAAEAARIYGTLDSTLPNLPAFKIGEEDIIFSGQVDRDWGNRGAPSIWIPEGKKHLVKTTAQLKSIDDAVAALANGYPITIASDWGGLMDPPVKGGNNPVRLNRRADTWFHQMMVSDYWDHPELGLIFHIDNSWGTSHGKPVSDSPVGGFWVAKGDLAYIIAQKEAFAFSDMEGFPERRIDQALLMLI